MARLRLQAGCCMLKLAQEQIYADLITLEQFNAISYLVVVSSTLLLFMLLIWSRIVSEMFINIEQLTLLHLVFNYFE